MSFRKILSQMQQLNQKDMQIRRKYSKKRRIQNQYHPSMKGSQEDEDFMIYGYTNTDIVKHFHKKQQFQCETFDTFHKSPNNNLNERRTIQRSKTAKIQYKNIRKYSNNKIAHSTQKNSLNATPKQNSFSEQRFQTKNIVFKNKRNQAKDQNIRKKSINKFRKIFKDGFQKNIAVAEIVRKTQSHTIAPKSTTFQPFRMSLQNVQNTGDFFMLTQQLPNRQSLNQINLFMNHVERLKLLQNLSMTVFLKQNCMEIQKILEHHRRVENIINMLQTDKKMACFLIDLKKLETIQLTGLKMNFLPKILQQFRLQKRNIHLCIVQKNGQNQFIIKYQEFIMEGLLSVRKKQEICSKIMQYFLNLFLLMDKQSYCIETATKTTLMFFQNLRKIPKGFQKFGQTIKYNVFKVRINQKFNKYWFYELYEGCLQKMKHFEKKSKQNATLLNKTDNKGKQQYFYICSFLLYFQIYIYSINNDNESPSYKIISRQTVVTTQSEYCEITKTQSLKLNPQVVTQQSQIIIAVQSHHQFKSQKFREITIINRQNQRKISSNEQINRLKNFYV